MNTNKIKNGIGANSLSQLVTILIQLLSVPMFLSKWGLDKYGVWVTISVIPTYLQLADAGFVSVAMNRMVIESRRGDWGAARGTYVATRLLLINIFKILLATLGVALVVSQYFRLLDLGLFVIFAILAMTAMASIYFGLYEAALRTCDKNATGVMLQTFARFFEFLGAMAGLFVSGEFIGVAAGGLFGRLVVNIFTAIITRKYCNALMSSAKNTKYSKEIIRELLSPALHFLVFPVSNALNIQGFTLVCGSVFGSSAVAQFSALRTLSRLVVQMGTVLGRSFWPEFSLAYGINDCARFWNILRVALMANAVVALVFVLLINIFGSKVLLFWTHGVIKSSALLLFLLTCGAAIHVIFMPLQVALLATNKHEELAKWTITSTTLAIFFAYCLGENFGLTALAIILICMEVILGAATYLKLLNLKKTMESA